MKIEVLGSRGKIKASAPNYKNHTGFLIDEQILIDLGEPQFLKKKPEAILFTHFHPDHAYFHYENKTFNPGIPHFGPEENELIPELQVIDKKFILNGYSFTPIPVIHALNLKSWGYIVEKDGKRVVFTGDVAWIEKEHLNALGQVDLIITEATIIDKGGRINRSGDKIYGHTGIPDLIRIFKPLTNKIVFTHYGNWFFEDIEAGLKKIKEMETESLRLIPAHDRFEIEI